MKPFTPTVLGKAPALVTSLGIFERQNHSVLMLANRRQNNGSYGQRARMLHLEPARLPPRQPQAPELLLPPGMGLVPVSKVRLWCCWTPTAHQARNCSWLPGSV